MAVMNGNATAWHSVVISRTGRVLNVLDVSSPVDAVSPATVADTVLTGVIAKQCGPAGGKCGGEAQVRVGPPPLGGDQPGFLAAGDLPPVAGSVSPWNAAPVELPQEDFVGSSCENVDWSTVAAEVAQLPGLPASRQRDELLRGQPDRPHPQGREGGEELVEKIKTNLEKCKERRLTATVSDPKKVGGIGAKGTAIAGYTATVEQKGTQGSDEFRVGIVQAGTKVAYSFANPKGDFDFTDAQWNTISVRAGERVTQVP